MRTGRTSRSIYDRTPICRKDTCLRQDPSYPAELYWTARRAVRRHSAAVGRFAPKRHFRRKGKGKGKGKGKHKKGGTGGLPPFATPATKGKGKGSGKAFYQEYEDYTQPDDAWWTPTDSAWPAMESYWPAADEYHDDYEQHTYMQ
eukprot:3069578-Amphidinium_carterae.1